MRLGSWLRVLGQTLKLGKVDDPPSMHMEAHRVIVPILTHCLPIDRLRTRFQQTLEPHPVSSSHIPRLAEAVEIEAKRRREENLERQTAGRR